MKRICYIIAMRAEGEPLIAHYALQERANFFAPLPCRLFVGTVGQTELCVVINGTDHDRDLIGCEAATMTTMAAIEKLRPDIVISSGTCGGWQRHGTRLGAVYIANAVMFHDRRVPGDNEWHTQGLGNYPVWSGSEALARRLQLPMGKVTTGSSFDLSAEDEAVIERYGGQLKEMEGAAVAFVAQQFGVPVMLVKAVTNLRDDANDDMTTFQTSLQHVAQALLKANIRIINHLTQLP